MTIDEPELPVIDLETASPRGPWIRGREWIEVEEVPGPTGGSSLYHLPGGRGAVLMEPTHTLPSALLAAIVLWRVIANATQICPCCGARARLAEGAAVQSATGTMEHENICVLSDGAMRQHWDELSTGDALPPDLPARPRRWRVRPPRMAINKPKRRKH